MLYVVALLYMLFYTALHTAATALSPHSNKTTIFKIRVSCSNGINWGKSSELLALKSSLQSLLPVVSAPPTVTSQPVSPQCCREVLPRNCI